MPSNHPNARTTPAVRVEIARSREPTGVLAKRCQRDHPQVAQARCSGTIRISCVGGHDG
jgi:type IV pilus biogenesis protein CpaD/CtpE